MSVIEIKLPQPSNIDFFDNDSLNYFLPEIRCITKLKKSEKPDADCRFEFTVYLGYGVDVAFEFSSYGEGRVARNGLLSRLSNHAGPDNIYFTCGHNSDVTTIFAIDDVTELFEKDRNASFSIFLKDVPFPLHVVEKNIERATAIYHRIKRGVEFERQQSAKEVIKVAVA